ncbi:MAG: transcriptional regulator [Planctomycetia bacterium]|nr:transcriptional regulator [Planctomycetia bacterium]
MKLHSMKLVTIVCEALARSAVTELLKEIGAHGYTLFPVEGVGAQGSRVADIEEFANIQIEIVLPPEAALQLLARLEQDFFARFAMIAYSTDIEVIRSSKF